jgi:hypothetical protein
MPPTGPDRTERLIGRIAKSRALRCSVWTRSGSWRVKTYLTMKPVLATTLVIAALAALGTTTAVYAQSSDLMITGGAGSFTPEARANNTDAVVHLTSDQKAKLIDILRREDVAMTQASSAEPRIPFFKIFEAAQKEIRALLTADQVKVYDRTPQRQGGGLTIIEPQFKVKDLDNTVGLASDQKAVALEIYTEEYESLRLLSPEERPTLGAKYREAATAQIQAILTPSQIARRDGVIAASTARADEEINAIEQAVHDSAGVAARVGPHIAIKRMGRSARNPSGDRLGDAHLKVTGDKGSETVVVYWERKPATAPVKITKITDAQNVVIAP